MVEADQVVTELVAPDVTLTATVEAVRAAWWSRPYMRRALAVAALGETDCELLFPPSASADSPGRRMSDVARNLRRTGLQVHPDVARKLIDLAAPQLVCWAAAKLEHGGSAQKQGAAASRALGCRGE